MKAKPYLLVATLALAVAATLSARTVTRSTEKAAPERQYRVDPFWPQPLPSDATGKQWVTGEVAGTCVDSQDHVFIVTRGFQNGLVAPETVIAVPSPPVIEFDPLGRVANSWGNPNVLPTGIHGCYVDYQDNVWIAGNGDGIVQKYSHGGQLLLQIGTRGLCDSPGDPTATPPVPAGTCGNFGTVGTSRTLLNQPATVAVDPANGEVFIADGYGNHRVVVFDRNGNYLRQWGGVVTNNNNPEPGSFASGDGGHPHCVTLSVDGLVYVCDRADDRIQVFTKQGQLVRVIPIVPGTGVTPGPNGAPALGTAGSAWDVAFSKDAAQTLMYEADGGNELMHVMDRALGTILSSWGGPGHEAGKFTFLHTVAIDSQSNLFTGETIGGRRIQKFFPVQCNSGNGLGNPPGNCGL